MLYAELHFDVHVQEKDKHKKHKHAKKKKRRRETTSESDSEDTSSDSAAEGKRAKAGEKHRRGSDGDDHARKKVITSLSCWLFECSATTVARMCAVVVGVSRKRVISTVAAHAGEEAGQG